MKRIFASLIIIFFSLNASALLELRGHFGFQNTSNNFNSILPDSGLSSIAPSLPAIPMYGADVVVNLPLMPIGFGLRYENLGFKSASNGITFDVSSQTTSILINKRFIDFFGYFGVLATYGISNSKSATLSLSGVQGQTDGNTSFMTGTPTVYQVGIEGGVKLIGWILGGELGYASHKFSDVDLSGTYLKAVVGFGF